MSRRFDSGYPCFKLRRTIDRLEVVKLSSGTLNEVRAFLTYGSVCTLASQAVSKTVARKGLRVRLSPLPLVGLRHSEI